MTSNSFLWRYTCIRCIWSNESKIGSWRCAITHICSSPWFVHCYITSYVVFVGLSSRMPSFGITRLVFLNLSSQVSECYFTNSAFLHLSTVMLTYYLFRKMFFFSCLMWKYRVSRHCIPRVVHSNPKMLPSNYGAAVWWPTLLVPVYKVISTQRCSRCIVTGWVM